MQTCLIFNPSARGQKAQAFRAQLGPLFPDCAIFETNGPGDARRLAAQAVRNGFATVVAVGGDGTANEVVNGLADVPRGLSLARLGLVPLGTINVFARELGLPRNLAGVARTLATGRELAIDLCRAEFTAGGRPEIRHFLQLAGAGLDARAVELVNWELKKAAGPLAYVAAGFRALRETQPLITVEASETITGQIALLGNGRYYGGSIEVFPGASLRDGLLDVCVLPTVNGWRPVQGVLGLATGRVHRFWEARHLRSAAVTLRGAGRVGLQLDGEYAGELPAKFSVLPQAVRVIVP
ncbi:MAG TPA: diacylglycerol kinase family protein [Verrucomicrobiae bacterium]